MKKMLTVSFALAVCFICTAPLFAAMPFAPKDIIAIHIGPKNVTFDESKFPDIKFYYTPGLKWTNEKTTGAPALLAEWLSKRNLRDDECIVIDKDGIVAFKNVLITFKRIEDIVGQGDLDSLGNVLRNVFENDKKAPYISNKPFSTEDLSMLGKKMPDFPVADSSGSVVRMNDLLSGENLPAMVFFFRIPPTHVFRDASESMSEVTSPLQALGAITNMSQGDEYTSLLERMERELYGR